MPLKHIKQTNNTILFEKFNNGDDLVTLLSNEWNDSLFKKIEDKLVVNNFDNFLEKFAPVVYIFSKDNGMPYFTAEKPENFNGKGIKLNKSNQILKLLLRMLDAKSTANKANIDFDYQTFLSDLTPKKILEEAKQIRKELEDKYIQYYNLDKENPARTKLIKTIGKYREKIAETYKDNPLNLLPLAISDTEEKIKLLSNNVSIENNGNVPQLGYSAFDDEGNLKFIAYEDNSIENNEEKDVDKKPLIEIIKNDYENTAIFKSEYVSDLIVSVFVGESLSARNELVLSEVVKKLDEHRKAYKHMQESFIKIAKDFIKKIIGVKLFFDQGNGKEKDNPKLLIANASLEMLAKNKNRIETFFKQVNNTIENKYWFAIAPNISLETEVKNEESYNDLSDYSINKNKNKTNNSQTSLSNFEVLANICEKAKVMTFFNIKADENSGFEALNTESISKHISDFEHIKSEYAVFSYPNFTILPADKSLINISEEKQVDNNGNLTQDGIKLVLNGIYVDSAYVAAGIVAAYQNPNILYSKGFKVIKNNPGVRFNIEESDNSLIFKTSIGRESILNWSKNIIDVINENRFGFSFCSDSVFLNGNALNNIFVYTARSLAKDGNKYKGIYKILTRDFIFAYLKQQTGSKQSKVNDFVKKGIGRKWTNEAEKNEFINLILRNGDGLELGEYETSTKIQKIKLTFESEEEIVDIEINE
jgi:hypothetical protein